MGIEVQVILGSLVRLERDTETPYTIARGTPILEPNYTFTGTGARGKNKAQLISVSPEIHLLPRLSIGGSENLMELASFLVHLHRAPLALPGM